MHYKIFLNYRIWVEPLQISLQLLIRPYGKPMILLILSLFSFLRQYLLKMSNLGKYSFEEKKSCEFSQLGGVIPKFFNFFFQMNTSLRFLEFAINYETKSNMLWLVLVTYFPTIAFFPTYFFLEPILLISTL